MIQAEVHLASGRFDEAVTAIERAAKNQNNREIIAVVTRVKAVASARKKGNELFKASKYTEACIAYGEGLHHDPSNAILLCNRAACHSKLGQWEKAIDDCNNVLSLKPSYTKARLRRADCFAKVGKWEASAQDYQILRREFPGDEEVARALSEAKSHLHQRKS
ncbi:inactive TPR repeat-containing thioredoxin TTL3-like [Phalaenopsis equestris]|uniref:inactive TPR repeat-containing thioredoxin TTL3-like n=1 Tax=Phalaenopsis equestris TaxID=78828 RepID=UPI0009E436AA|nr:inactive TPR repeat-containing thioredoxin TTL3-like [Phalaenopsis equestris]